MKTWFVQKLLKIGDIYSLENHRLCEDHMPSGVEVASVMNTMACNTVCDVCLVNRRDEFAQYRHDQKSWLSVVIPGSVCYIAGPMSGMAEHNKPAFHRMEHLLKSEGFKVLSPAHWEEGLPYETYMQRDVELLITASSVVMLLGWQGSNGATLEHAIAKNTGKRIVYELKPSKKGKTMYHIYWRSKVNGKSGHGTKSFSQEEAVALATELNRDYPNIEHVSCPDEPSASPPVTAKQPCGQTSI